LTIQQPDHPVTEPAPAAESLAVNLGDAPERIVAALGQPKNIVNLGARQIYIYANLKITFEYGKVTDVQ
jgi:hypothetical protein